MKRIPYGIDDFDRIILEDYYYIDKTRYIKTVEEQSSYLLFVRPRRMGKSLFVNMLMSYYDIAKKDKFDNLFGDLSIGRDKTTEANSYLVLKFDFSKVTFGHDELVTNFTNYCNAMIDDFLLRYTEYFTDAEKEKILTQSSAKDAITVLNSTTNRKGLRTYLFIDEYDNFSNTVLSARGVKAHESITHGEGFYRDFFKACKGSFQRIFMTGVAPVTYDDLTSGFNIADVVALRPQFDKIVGVTETELRDMIEYYRSEGRITRPTDDIIAEMKPWYDNFCFAERCYGIEPPIYNTDMVMRYIKELILTGYPPEEMLDTNARTDYQELNNLVISEDLDNRRGRINLIKEICANGYTNGTVHEQFPAFRCGDEENFKSLLFFFGTLTFGGWDNRGTKLIVPNKTMGELYLQYMLHLVEYEGYDLYKDYKPLMETIFKAAIEGKWQSMVEKVGECYSNYSSIRNAIRGEADVQGFIRGLLCLNDYYDIWPELELGKGFCDILLLPKSTPRCPTKFSYVIEIKYMKSGETDVDEYVAEACHQLDRYVSDKHLDTSPMLHGASLTKLYMVFKGQHLVRFGQHN